MIGSHHRTVINHMTECDSVDLTELYCDYLLVLLEYNVVTDTTKLTDKLLHWILKHSHTGQ